MSTYRCMNCDVVGNGEACWSCQSTDLVRYGPPVDTVVYDLETDHTAHHMTHERADA